MGKIKLLAAAGALLTLWAAWPAAAQKTRPPAQKRIVYAWFPKEFARLDPSGIEWSAITHLSFRSIVLQPDGSIHETQPRGAVKKLVDEAHKHGVRVDVLVWGSLPKDAWPGQIGRHSSEYLANHQHRAVQSLLDYVKANDLDGIDMDDETWRERNSVTGESNRELVTQFFRGLTDAFRAARADYQVFWDAPAVINPQDKFAESWPDFKAISAMVDGLCIMSYTMNPPTIGWTGGRQPVGGGGKVTDHPRDYSTCIKDYLEATGGRKDKLVLGIGVDQGGFEWLTRWHEPLAPIVGEPRQLSAKQARANAEKYGRRFDSQQKEPWYRYQRDGGWVQGWYEDDEAFAAKLELAREQQIGGVCLWVLDGANDPRSVFDLTRKYLKAQQAKGGLR
ncbi:MAG: glycosyl hydrolase family 18 protein [Thermoguttaceae bacterium]